MGEAHREGGSREMWAAVGSGGSRRTARRASHNVVHPARGRNAACARCALPGVRGMQGVKYGTAGTSQRVRVAPGVPSTQSRMWSQADEAAERAELRPRACWGSGQDKSRLGHRCRVVRVCAVWCDGGGDGVVVVVGGRAQSRAVGAALPLLLRCRSCCAPTLMMAAPRCCTQETNSPSR